MTRLGIVLAGGFGGVAPSLIEFARMLQSDEINQWLQETPDYWFSALCAVTAIAVFFLIGSSVALIYKESVASKAMLLGISAPALILAATTGQAPKPHSVDLISVPVVSWVFPSAFAQEQDMGSGSISLRIAPSTALGRCMDCTVDVFDADDRLLASEPIGGSPVDHQDEDATVTVEVPDSASTILMNGSDTNPVSIDVQQLGQEARNRSGGAVTIDVSRDRNYWNDLRRSFGNDVIRPYDFDVSLEK